MKEQTKWGIFDEPVIVKLFHNHNKLQDFLNYLALEAANKHDLRFLTENSGSYTAVFIFVPETKE